MMGIFNKIIKVIRKPDEFFEEAKQENDIKVVLKYYLVIVAIAIPINLVMGLIAIGLDFYWYVIFFLLSVLGTLVVPSVFHGVAWLLKARKGFFRTMQAFLYGYTPYILLSWTSNLSQDFSYVVLLFSVYLIIIGMKILHEITWRRTILIFSIPPLIVMFFNYLIILA